MTNKEYLMESDDNLYRFMFKVAEEDPSFYAHKYCEECAENGMCTVDIEGKCRYTDREMFQMWLEDEM